MGGVAFHARSNMPGGMHLHYVRISSPPLLATGPPVRTTHASTHQLVQPWYLRHHLQFCISSQSTDGRRHASVPGTTCCACAVVDPPACCCCTAAAVVLIAAGCCCWAAVALVGSPAATAGCCWAATRRGSLRRNGAASGSARHSCATTVTDRERGRHRGKASPSTRQNHLRDCQAPPPPLLPPAATGWPPLRCAARLRQICVYSWRPDAAVGGFRRSRPKRKPGARMSAPQLRSGGSGCS